MAKLNSVNYEKIPEGGFDVNVEVDGGDLYRYLSPQKFKDEHAVVGFCMRVKEAGEVDLSHWGYWRTVYGSEAYQRDGHEQAQIEREWYEDHGY